MNTTGKGCRPFRERLFSYRLKFILVILMMQLYPKWVNGTYKTLTEVSLPFVNLAFIPEVKTA